jgi:pimeloyl-ACP methyl ester carboxylesterase
MNFVTEICVFKTSDNERLHGALLTSPDSPPDVALVLIHGVAMNFYLPPLFLFAQQLAARGFHCFSMNTRGHDWISRAGNLTRFGGAAFENLDDCFLDLDGALAFLGSRGYRQFVLIGHSLGAIKSIIYQGTRRRPDVDGIVACSTPKQFYSERIAREPKFRELIERAELMVAEGRGQELMSVPVGATPGIFSARTHLDKYGKDDRNDCRQYAKTLDCPLLAIIGDEEPKPFHEYAQEIVANAGPDATYEKIAGGNHFYHRRSRETVDLIHRWLAGLKASRLRQ